MVDSFLIKIDVMKLRSRLSSPGRRPMTNGDVFNWLLDKGFSIRARGWCGSSAALNELKEAEIIICERIG